METISPMPFAANTPWSPGMQTNDELCFDLENLPMTDAIDDGPAAENDALTTTTAGHDLCVSTADVVEDFSLQQAAYEAEILGDSLLVQRFQAGATEASLPLSQSLQADRARSMILRETSNMFSGAVDLLDGLFEEAEILNDNARSLLHSSSEQSAAVAVTMRLGLGLVCLGQTIRAQGQQIQHNTNEIAKIQLAMVDLGKRVEDLEIVTQHIRIPGSQPHPLLQDRAVHARPARAIAPMLALPSNTVSSTSEITFCARPGADYNLRFHTDERHLKNMALMLMLWLTGQTLVVMPEVQDYDPASISMSVNWKMSMILEPSARRGPPAHGPETRAMRRATGPNKICPRTGGILYQTTKPTKQSSYKSIHCERNAYDDFDMPHAVTYFETLAEMIRVGGNADRVAAAQAIKCNTYSYNELMEISEQIRGREANLTHVPFCFITAQSLRNMAALLGLPDGYYKSEETSEECLLSIIETLKMMGIRVEKRYSSGGWRFVSNRFGAQPSSQQFGIFLPDLLPHLFRSIWRLHDWAGVVPFHGELFPLVGIMQIYDSARNLIPLPQGRLFKDAYGVDPASQLMHNDELFAAFVNFLRVHGGITYDQYMNCSSTIPSDLDASGSGSSNVDSDIDVLDDVLNGDSVLGRRSREQMETAPPFDFSEEEIQGALDGLLEEMEESPRRSKRQRTATYRSDEDFSEPHSPELL